MGSLPKDKYITLFSAKLSGFNTYDASGRKRQNGVSQENPYNLFGNI